jgi:hypothetical protein
LVIDIQSSDWLRSLSLQLANGTKSLVQNNTNPLDTQSANGDSSRAGQIFNTVAYGGFTNPTWGTMTVGRQNSLILDGLGLYDAMAATPAFSVIGASFLPTRWGALGIVDDALVAPVIWWTCPRNENACAAAERFEIDPLSVRPPKALQNDRSIPQRA